MSLYSHKEEIMEWTTPQFEEVSLNCEINSYANAEL
jgi:coenzyme PQQ precursor peptide PqqA